MGIETVLAIFFSFIIGIIFGGMAAFLSRRMMINRQIRIAERKAARITAEARTESKDILQAARQETDKMKSGMEFRVSRIFFRSLCRTWMACRTLS